VRHNPPSADRMAATECPVLTTLGACCWDRYRRGGAADESRPWNVPRASGGKVPVGMETLSSGHRLRKPHAFGDFGIVDPAPGRDDVTEKIGNFRQYLILNVQIHY